MASYAGSVDLNHWAKLPVTVCFTNDTEMQRTSFKSVALSGFDEWVAATGGAVSYTLTDNPDQADIVVSFVAIPGAPAMEFAHTNMSITDAHEYEKAEMTIFTWKGMTKAQVQRGLKTTAAHEFGHALGINGHSESPSDVMYYGRQVNKPVDVPVSIRDLNTLKTAYGGRLADPAMVANGPGKDSGAAGHAPEDRRKSLVVLPAQKRTPNAVEAGKARRDGAAPPAAVRPAR